MVYQPHPIEKESYDIIEGLVDLSSYSPELREIYKRVIHTTGDASFIKDMRISDGAVDSGIAAILHGALLVTDVTMVQAGLKRSLIEKWKLKSVCFIHDDEIHKKALRENTTRATASIRHLAAQKINTPVILIIGDAPTALQEAVNLVLSGQLRPDLIIGIPVGFVGTESSKQALMAQNRVPYITNKGTRGGSTVAASIFNALMILATRKTN
jgi:precorrin-8X/cobalt-precorrin-8 methylmutase